MPEVKRDFRGGKMNKDLDERLVPNGEYRDALNIQVAGSEGSDVGSAQNILGTLNLGPNISQSTCIGVIADNENNKIYWFVHSAGASVKFDTDFIELARAVYKENDKRANLKRKINNALGSELIEEKSYSAY